MWMNILTPNPTKYEAWLRRVVTSFKVKVDRARSGGGKAPNLRSGAVRQPSFCTPCVSPKNTDCGPQEQFPIEHSLVPTSIAEGQFRDADPQLVFQCSMLWGTYAGNIKTVVGQETYEQLDGMFARGAFDVPLAAQIKLRDENFKLENLSFMQSYLEGPTEVGDVEDERDGLQTVQVPPADGGDGLVAALGPRQAMARKGPRGQGGLAEGCAQHAS